MISLCFLLFSLNLLGQKEETQTKNFPFQVLYARNVTEYNVALNHLDYVMTRTALIVGEDGRLILVHSSGKVFEFAENTTVEIKEILRDQLKAPRERFDIRGLFSLNRTYKIYSDRLNTSGAILRCSPSPPIKVIHPPFNDLDHCPKDSAYLVWQNRDNELIEAYIVSVKNIFDEVISTHITKDTSILISLNNENLISEGLAQVHIVDKNNERLSSRPLAFKLTPSVCDTSKSAPESLLKAYNLEKTNDVLGAFTAYKKALTLATEDMKPFYQEMIDNFKARTGYAYNN